jgi:hypothetical protein
MIKELIQELLKIEDQEKEVTIVVGDEDDNIIDTSYFELHHCEDIEHPLEIFVLIDDTGKVINTEDDEKDL